MKPTSIWAGGPLAVVLMLTSFAFAGPNDYAFEPVKAEVKKGDGATVSVRLVHKPSGKPVGDAVIIRTRVDMGPDNMADMVSPVAAVPSNELGVYAFKIDLPMAGRYLLSVAAKVQGETGTLENKLVVTAEQ